MGKTDHLLQQACIVHGHTLSGLSIKVGEVILADLSVSFERLIDTPEFSIKMRQYAYSVEEPVGRRRHPRVSHFWNFVFGENAWTGRIRGVFPFR